MLTLMNRARVETRRGPLVSNPTLRKVARRYGREMFSFGYLSHRSRDGRTPWDRVTDAGALPECVGENLVYASDVHTAHGLMMNSPEHRQNILSTDYHRVGIGVIDAGYRGVIVVEDFTN